MRSTFFPMIGCLLSLPIVAAAQKKYPIRIDRPDHVGRVYEMSATGDSHSALKMTSPGIEPRVRDEAFTVRFEATTTVLAVNDSGQPTKLSIKIQKCLRNDTPLFEPGATIVAEATDGATKFSTDGRPVDSAATPILGIVVNLRTTSKSGDDDAIFGSKVPRALGESWPIDPHAAAESATADGIPIDPASVSGSARLTAISERNGVRALRIDATMNVGRFHGSLKGVQIDSGEMKAGLGGLFPVDPKLPALEFRQSMHTHLIGSALTPAHSPVTIDMVEDRHLQIRFGPPPS